jgi:hypothetical protein
VAILKEMDSRGCGFVLDGKAGCLLEVVSCFQGRSNDASALYALFGTLVVCNALGLLVLNNWQWYDSCHSPDPESHTHNQAPARRFGMHMISISF